jgi:hypothetical protein
MLFDSTDITHNIDHQSYISSEVSKYLYIKLDKELETVSLDVWFVTLMQLAFQFINHLKTKRRLFHLKTQSVPRSKHISHFFFKFLLFPAFW